jgi:hypothetical protein
LATLAHPIKVLSKIDYPQTTQKFPTATLAQSTKCGKL